MSTFGDGAEIGGGALPSPRPNGVRLGRMSFAGQARLGWMDEKRRSRRTPKDVNAARSPANSHPPGWTGVHFAGGFRVEIGRVPLPGLGGPSKMLVVLVREDALWQDPRLVGKRVAGGLGDLVFWFFCG